MDLIPVTLNGDYLEVNPISLDEHIALGWTVCEKQADASPKRMSVAEVRDALSAKGIAFDVSLKKADLIALLDSVSESPAATDFVEGPAA